MAPRKRLNELRRPRQMVRNGSLAYCIHRLQSLEIAHAQVLKMQEVAHKASNGDVEALKHVHHAFGNNPNLPAIHGHIQALHDGKYSVQDAHGGHSGMGAYNPNTGHVSFGSAFHSTLTKDHERAGAVLHESSHKILGTKDVWSGSGQPLDKTKPGPGDHIGCMFYLFVSAPHYSHLDL